MVANRWIPVSADIITKTDLFIAIFLGILYEALPFLTAGALISAAIHQFLDPQWLAQRLPKSRWLTALIGALLGIFLPICECGSIPAARSLVYRGAPVSLGVAFAIAAPVMNPIVLISTSVAFAGVYGWSFVLWRFGLTVVIAVLTAVLTPTLTVVPSSTSEFSSSHEHAHADDEIPFLVWLRHALGDLLDMVRYVIIGASMAAIIQIFVSNAVIVQFARQAWLAIPVAMLLAVVMSICSTVDAFVALSLAGSFSPVALMAFLVFGPIIDFKSIPMFAAVFGWRPIPRFVAMIAVLTIVLCSAIWRLGWV
ncbi:MAG: hypothetical protein EBS29_05480 [Chloroflexia bacterium]|nr:hypothetical protein [Chloroflexia bacterium]